MSNGCRLPMLHADRPSLNTQSCIKGFWWYGFLLFGPVGQPGQYILKISKNFAKASYFCVFFFSNIMGKKNIFNSFGILKSKCTKEGPFSTGLDI